MQDPYLQPGTSDHDNYFDLSDAGEDEADEDPLAEEYCFHCEVLLTEADFEAEECTQCHTQL